MNPTPSAPASPKILQTRLLRTALALFVAAAAILTYFYLTSRVTSDTGTANTKGDILAINLGERSNRAVIIKPDLSIVKSPGDESAGIDDQEAVWRPDGNRIFVSRSLTASKNPEESNFQIYRWNPDNEKFERRTIGTRALSHPRFEPSDKTADAMALATAGGRVLLFDPAIDSRIHQILPPLTKNQDAEVTQAGEGQDMGPGLVFREARWTFDKSYIAAVMRTENGEALLIQKMNPTTDAEKAPKILVAADHIDFDVSPNSNDVIFSTLNFQFPDPSKIPDEAKKEGKIVRPYFHSIQLVNADLVYQRKEGMLQAVKKSSDDSEAYGQPVFSPDGNSFLVVHGTYVSGTGFTPQRLFIYTLKPQPSAQPLAAGAIYDPSWHPAGNRLLFVRKEANGERDILEIVQGSAEKSLTQGKGNFSHPVYSPQSQ